MNRGALAELLAPVAPPCFADRLSWVEYVVSAAAAQKRAHTPGPLLFVKGEPVQFDPNFSYCEDCDVATRTRMLKADRCNPEAVRQQFMGIAIVVEVVR